MFKLKAGNVIQKINKMDRRQAYTIGAIVVVVFIALLMLASFTGKADDASFDGMSTRGYDLAQMPFVSDEAEAYLLASKYPDMQGNASSFLYSPQEKEARQLEDAENMEDKEVGSSGGSFDSDFDSDDDSYGGRGYGGYGGRGGRDGRGGTTVGQLGSARVGSASGGGLNTTYGAPRGDFSPYKSQDKGTEIPAQLRKEDAKKALFQSAQASRAAAGLKDSKARNANRALMGGNVKGSDAFTDKGVDLSKTNGLALDTNAPVTSPDLSNLEKDLGQAAQDAKDRYDQMQNSFWDQMLSQMVGGLMNMGINALGNGINAMLDKAAFSSGTKGFGNGQIDNLKNMSYAQFKSLPEDTQKALATVMGTNLESMTRTIDAIKLQIRNPGGNAERLLPEAEVTQQINNIKLGDNSLGFSFQHTQANRTLMANSGMNSMNKDGSFTDTSMAEARRNAGAEAAKTSFVSNMLGKDSYNNSLANTPQTNYVYPSYGNGFPYGQNYNPNGYYMPPFGNGFNYGYNPYVPNYGRYFPTINLGSPQR